jgi:ClpP class serine protease
VASFSIEGVLFQKSFSMCGFEIAQGYDSILRTARAAFGDTDVGAVNIIADSPGGDAAGMIECARELRRMADESGLPLFVYVDELAASAMYGLAVAADEIIVPESAEVGSIGTIWTAMNSEAALAAEGHRAIVAASPPGKAIGHPLLPVQDSGRERMQRTVEAFTGLFAEHVASRRASLTVSSIMALDAGVFMGAEAVSKGLADKVSSRRDAIAMARSRIKRKAYSMGDTNSKAEAMLSSLLRVVGLDAAASPEQVEAACKQTSALARVGAKAAELAPAVPPEELDGIVAVWHRQATKELPAAHAELRIRHLQLGVSTGRLTPAQAYADGGTPAEREYPATPEPSALYGAMSLAAMKEHIKLSAPLPETMRKEPRRRAAMASIDDKTAQQAGFKNAAEYKAHLDQYGSPAAEGDDQ